MLSEMQAMKDMEEGCLALRLNKHGRDSSSFAGALQPELLPASVSTD